MSASGSTMPVTATTTIPQTPPQSPQIQKVKTLQCATKVVVAPPVQLQPPLASKPPIVVSVPTTNNTTPAQHSAIKAENQSMNGDRISPPMAVNVVSPNGNSGRKRSRDEMAAKPEPVINANQETGPSSAGESQGANGVVSSQNQKNEDNSGEPPAKRMKTMVVSNNPVASDAATSTTPSTSAPSTVAAVPTTAVALSSVSTVEAVASNVDSSSMSFSNIMVQGSMERDDGGESQCYLIGIDSVHNDETAVSAQVVTQIPQKSESENATNPNNNVSAVAAKPEVDQTNVATAPTTAAVTSATNTVVTATTPTTTALTVDAMSSDPFKGKVLTRRFPDLKRYLHDMDDEVLRNDLIPKLCIKKKTLFESIRKKMNENSVLCKIFIRSLSYETQDKTVHDLFATFGNVKEAVIVNDRMTGLSRGFGFITMSNASEAQKALAEHQKLIDGREAICNLASKPQGQRPLKSSFHHFRKREDFHYNRGPPAHNSFARKRTDPPPPQPRQPAPAPYPYPNAAANPYGYGYPYPAGGAAAMNPYAYANPYAQYNQSAAAATNATTNTTPTQSAAATTKTASNVTAQPYSAQPYQPAMAGQNTNVAGAMPAFNPAAASAYRFN